MRLLLMLAVIVVCQTGNGPALAHEFWIAPIRYQLKIDQPIIADIRVGDKFKGPVNAYLPDAFTRFEIIQAGKTSPVPGRLGDIPALNAPAPGEGLAVIVHETSGQNVRYLKWGKFVSFTSRKGFPDAAAKHKARGLPESGFMEHFRRFVKSLVAVGHGRGSDAEAGLETEFIAEKNPYADDLAGLMPVRLLYKGAPRAGAQIEVFARGSNGSVTFTRVTTDASGRAGIPVAAGSEYLLDAVVMRPLEAADPVTQPVWESLWAGMTFKIPGPES